MLVLRRDEKSLRSAVNPMESRAIQVYNPSMAALNRARAALSTAPRSEVPWLMHEFLAELENLCPIQGVIPAPAQRSPLPVWWYPRRPLQDITGILNSTHGSSTGLPKRSAKKKTQACWPMEKEDQCGIPKLPTSPTMFPNTAASVANRGSLLRKGFR